MTLKKSTRWLSILAMLVFSLVHRCNAGEIDDDLADFDFDMPQHSHSYQQQPQQLNQQDRSDPQHQLFDYYEDEGDTNSQESQSSGSSSSSSSSSSSDSLKQFDETPEDDGGFSFRVKEKVLRTALSKALTNKKLRRKFVEVIPILRVLSKPQRLALAALISAQISAKPGTELKLDQVKSMFGDNKKLILPLVLDIANLVRTAAKSSLSYDYKYPEPYGSYEGKFSRKNFEVEYQKYQKHKPEPVEEEFDEELPEIPEDLIDAQAINEQLFAKSLRSNFSLLENVRYQRAKSRKRRSADPAPGDNKKVEKYLPLFSQRRYGSEDRSFHERKLNMTSFQGPNDQMAHPTDHDNSLNQTKVTELPIPYDEVEDLALEDLNGTSSREYLEKYTVKSTPEELPVPESLIGGPRHRHPPQYGKGYRKPPSVLPRAPSHNLKQIIDNRRHCERFSSSMCIKTEDYPMDQIMGSIRRHRHAMTALLAEYRDKTAELEHEEYLEELLLKKRREDEVTPGGMCSSIVRYARPQKARSASGEWKYIVNTGEHTQTLRLEKCSNPQESCSYLSENYRSRCIQVYNYHRLLSWDKTRGLHVDIFKVPTCCSCHVDGYRETFPPLSNPGFSFGKQKDFTPSVLTSNHYSTIVDDEDETDEDEDPSESIAYQFSNGFKRTKTPKFEPSTLLASGSSLGLKTKTKPNYSTPVLGSYLNPPSNDYETKFPFKRGPTIGNFLLNTKSKRTSSPNLYGDDNDRSDQTVSHSEIVKEVTVYPTIDTTTDQTKRKRISSVSSTATPTRPRSVSSTTFRTPSPSTTTLDTKTLLNTKLMNTKTDSKRINYNYHPIIDFFEEQPMPSSPPSILSHSPTSFSASKTRKRGGANALNNRRIGGLNDQPDEENWRPMIVE